MQPQTQHFSITGALWKMTSSLTAPSSSQLIFIKLNICAVLCKGRNINQNVRGASRRAALTAGQAPATSLPWGTSVPQRRRESSEAEF